MNKRESQIHELKPVTSPQNDDDVSTFEQLEDSFELSEPSVRLELPIKPSFQISAEMLEHQPDYEQPTLSEGRARIESLFASNYSMSGRG